MTATVPARSSPSGQPPAPPPPSPPQPPGEPAPQPAGTAASAVAPVLPLVAAIPAALVAGIVLDVAYPGVGFWPAAYAAPGLLLLAVAGRSARTGLGLGLLFGLGFFVPHLQWSGTFVGAMPWLALAALQALLLAPVGGLWPACWRLAQRRGLLWTLPLTTAAVWLAVEALRSRVPFGGFPWGRLGFSQSDSPLAWFVSIGGIPGLGALVVAVSVSLAVLGLAAARAASTRRREPAGRPLLRGALVVTAAALVAASGLAGLGRWASDTRGPDDQTVTVAAIQGNVPEAGLDFNAERRAVTDNHAQATRQLAADVAAGRLPAVDLVLWPENSSDIDPLRNEDAAAVIGGATDAVGVPVLVGAVLREPAENNTNAMLVWEPGTGYRGDATGRYAKQVPVPFAEYIPYRAFFRAITPLVDEVPRNFVPGPGPAVLDVGAAAVGPVICFEVAEDAIVGEQVRRGADLLAVPTNNATFGFSDESTQQIVMSKLRAMEHGRAVVHASTVGVSGIYQPDGSSTELTELFTQDVVVADVPLRTELTPSARVGQWPELVVSTLVAAGAVALVLRSLRGRLRRTGEADR